uniref:Aminopeptidase n=1 Tax=Sitophilus oryzae TaxID=7048 RepID=D9J2G1_SITOR|nr:aminopeptidase N [Sitophilus oryzae]
MRFYPIALFFIGIFFQTISPERLPSLEISTYKLHLTLNESTFYTEPYQFKGYLQTKLTVSSAYGTDLQLRADPDFITIEKIFLDDTEMTEYFFNTSSDVLTIENTKNKIGDIYGVTLYIHYRSRLSTNDMYGLYRTSFGSKGAEKYIALSQFSPNFARRVFPCFDEPTFKTNFQFYVSYTEGIEVFSNTLGSVIDTTDVIGDDPTLETIEFKGTRKLSSYMTSLIFMHKNDFSCSAAAENVSEYGGAYRVCSRSGSESSRTWALETGPTLIRKLINFTNFVYFDKMDLMAVPHSVVAAEENWGLITFREENLLFNTDDASILDLERITMLMAYEFAQMWFGNVATPQWWSISYVTKGLATYLQYFITHQIFEEWELDKQFLSNVLHPAFEIDSFIDSPPLNADAESRSDIITKLDKITNLKGACLFRMLKDVIAGYEKFRQGIEYFLTSFSYKNTESQGLWNLISAQLNFQRGLLPTNKVLKEVLLNWEVYPGYPLLEVSRDSYKTFFIKQKGRFLYSGLNETYQWYIPVSYTLSTNLTQFENATLSQWLLPNETIEIFVPTINEKWIILNTQAAGYYRVHYGETWSNISEGLQDTNFSGIPELNRAQLLNDMFSLARANIVNYTTALNFTKYLKNEEDHYPWTSALQGFNYILRRIYNRSKLKSALLDFLSGLITNVYGTVPWNKLDDSNYSYTLKQVDILTGACHFGHAECVENAVGMFEDFKTNGNRPNKNLRELVYCLGLRQAKDSENWNFLWNIFEATTIESEKLKLINAFGCSTNEDLLKSYLAMTLDSDSEIKPHQASTVFAAVYKGSNLGARLAFEFLAENQEEIITRYQDMNCLKSIGLDLAEHLTSVSHKDKIKTFFFNRTDEFKPVSKQVLEVVENNEIWLEENLQELYDHFSLDPDDEIIIPDEPSKAEAYNSQFILILLSIIVYYV